MGLADARKPETTSTGRPCDARMVRSTYGTGQDLFSCTIGSSGYDGIRYERLIDPSRGAFTTIICRFRRAKAYVRTGTAEEVPDGHLGLSVAGETYN